MYPLDDGKKWFPTITYPKVKWSRNIYSFNPKVNDLYDHMESDSGSLIYFFIQKSLFGSGIFGHPLDKDISKIPNYSRLCC